MTTPTALRLTDGAFSQAAATLHTDVASVKAVKDVESGGGGFLTDGRPKILFEGHVFSRLTARRYDHSHPTVSYKVWTKAHYIGGAGEYRRLNEALTLDPAAALKSASWGLFQIMGENYAHCGYASVEEFVAAMKTGEDAQLEAFVNYLRAVHLDDELRHHDWRMFAQGYNGSAYYRNHYDTRLATAYKLHLSDRPVTPMVAHTLSHEAALTSPDGTFPSQDAPAYTSVQEQGAPEQNSEEASFPLQGQTVAHDPAADVREGVLASPVPPAAPAPLSQPAPPAPPAKETLPERIEHVRQTWGSKLTAWGQMAAAPLLALWAGFRGLPAYAQVAIFLGSAAIGAWLWNKSKQRQHDMQRLLINTAADKDKNTVHVVPPEQ
jgi:hypothetical protein